MRIWVDLANAPHVAFFLPIIREFENRGHSVVISMRDFNQTVELARKNGLQGTEIGTHGGKSSLGKLLNLINRSRMLASFGQQARIDIAVSHNSYTQTIAGRLIGARVVTIMDYEGQPANHIAFRLAHKVIVPAVFPESALRRFGCPESRVYRYNGFKEQVYLSDFQPNPGFVGELSRACALGKDWDPEGSVIVTVRTPASMAAYHHFENLLFEKLLERLNAQEGLTVIILPRTPSQRMYYSSRFTKFHIPDEPLSGNDLVYFSDLVVSAGGTMNREAAVLGTPVCTIFGGELPAVDRSLISMGRLTSIQTEGDLGALRFEKKRKGRVLSNSSLCGELASQIDTW
jgi:predicted glycosyltransferase